MLAGNPLLVRVVQGGSRQTRHLWVRMGYLGLLLAVMGTGMLIAGAASTSLNDLAKAGTKLFAVISYLQMFLVCLLAPVFMAAALTREQTGQTYDILLTTPMSSLQIVLGTLGGRLFFILTLLASGIPLDAVLLLLGGVPISSVFVALILCALVAISTGSVAVALSTRRGEGRRTLFAFITMVVVVLVGTWLADLGLRNIQAHQGMADRTTWLTPTNPLLVLETFVNSANYRPATGDQVANRAWIVRLWLSRPLTSFMLMNLLGSAGLIVYSAVKLRQPSDGSGRRFHWLAWLGQRNRQRRSQTVWHDAVAWREAQFQRSRMNITRFLLPGISLLLSLIAVLAYHRQLPIAPLNQPISARQLHQGLTVLLMIQLAVILLVSLYLSAGSISREREDGTLDLLLTTPITPKQYLWGKLRGIVSHLLILIAGPVLMLAVFAGYSFIGQSLGWPTATMAQNITRAGGALSIQAPTAPLLLAETPVTLALLVLPFTALCVAIGMFWSVRSTSVLMAAAKSLAVAAIVAGFFSCCGFSLVRSVPALGPAINSLSPITGSLVLINPWEMVEGFADNPMVGRLTLLGASLVSAGIYFLIVYSLMQTMVKEFDHSVRRLSGTAN